MALIIYNTTDGSPLLIQHNDDTNNYASVVVDIPSDKQLVSIDPTSKEPIFEDRPLSVEERLAQLEASQSDQDDAIDALAESLGGE